jgi:protein-disulfide isomerase
VPSGKKSKQARRAAARTPPPVASKGSGRRARQADPRILLGIGAVIVLAVVGIVLGFAFSGGGSSGVPKDAETVGSLANGLPGAAEAEALYKGIPQDGLELGSPLAPVRMVMYIDLQCPLCQQFETTVMTNVVPKYIRTGKVRLEVKPWAFIGPDSVRGQAAMFAAAKQNRAFQFAQVLYLNQGTENTGWLDDQMIYQIAVSVPGMDIPKLLADRKTSEVKSEASAVAASALADDVNGTPTVFIGKSGSKPALVGSPGLTPTQDEVEQAIADASA